MQISGRAPEREIQTDRKIERERERERESEMERERESEDDRMGTGVPHL